MLKKVWPKRLLQWAKQYQKKRLIQGAGIYTWADPGLELSVPIAWGTHPDCWSWWGHLREGAATNVSGQIQRSDRGHGQDKDQCFPFNKQKHYPKFKKKKKRGWAVVMECLQCGWSLTVRTMFTCSPVISAGQHQLAEYKCIDFWKLSGLTDHSFIESANWSYI